MDWFANKGQIVQIGLTTIACILAGIKAWPDIRANEMFTAGALMFYFLMALVVFSAVYGIVIVQRGARPSSVSQLRPHAVAAHEPEETSALKLRSGRATLTQSRGAKSPYGAPFLSTTTAGRGEQELKFGYRPKKLFFEAQGKVVSEPDLQTAAAIGERSLTIRRFGDTGVVVDDHAQPTDVNFYVLEIAVGPQDEPIDVSLTVQKVLADFAATATYRNKVRVILTNASGNDISAWKPLWEANTDEVACQQPLGTSLQLEGPRGWQANDWLEEQDCIKVPIGRTFRTWIGLTEAYGEGIERRIQNSRVGTLVLPLKINGRLAVKRIRI